MLKLREGKEYKFFVEKEITLPDSTNHFLLKGPDENKYLIPLARYSHYGIAAGTVINCRVDRINCKGAIFLEPQNPWYSEGRSYDFLVDGKEIRTDNSGINHDVVIVTDRNGSKILIPYDLSLPFPERGTKINLMVERITKGKVYLVATSRRVGNKLLRSGHNYEFVIERIEKGMDDEEYFVVKDPFGYMHTIARELYEYYGFTVGTLFKGKIVRYGKNGERTIEPENPFYKAGSLMKLEVTSFTKSVVNQSFTINLTDKFGFIHCIESAMVPEAKSIKCRVVMIKKGKPLFERL